MVDFKGYKENVKKCTENLYYQKLTKFAVSISYEGMLPLKNIIHQQTGENLIYSGYYLLCTQLLNQKYRIY
mgnify:CR=1 FL=1